MNYTCIICSTDKQHNILSFDIKKKAEKIQYSTYDNHLWQKKLTKIHNGIKLL